METTEIDLRQTEVWEATTDGTTWLHKKNPQIAGTWRQHKVGGRGSKRITLTVEERLHNQELMPYENDYLDPFTNGTLIRVSPAEGGERSVSEVSNAQLLELFEISNDDVFASEVGEIGSEVVLRRLLALAEKHASMVRYNMVRDVVEDRYKRNKTQTSVADLYTEDGKFRGHEL